MLVLPGKRHDLFHFCRSDVLREDAAYTHAFSVHLEHHPRCPFAVHSKKFLQHDYDEIHRREVVVEQKHFVQRRWLSTCVLGFDEKFVLLLRGHANHSNEVEAECNTAGDSSNLGVRQWKYKPVVIAMQERFPGPISFRDGAQRKYRLILIPNLLQCEKRTFKKLLTLPEQVRKSKTVRRGKFNVPVPAASVTNVVGQSVWVVFFREHEGEFPRIVRENLKD